MSFLSVQSTFDSSVQVQVLRITSMGKPKLTYPSTADPFLIQDTSQSTLVPTNCLLNAVLRSCHFDGRTDMYQSAKDFQTPRKWYGQSCQAPGKHLVLQKQT